MISSIDRRKSIEGMLFGIAVGDALGLAYEGLNRRQILRRLRRRPPQYALVSSRGLGSDEIQMAGMTGQAILRSVCKSENFLDSLAWSFRWWFVGLPFGIGLGTAKACIKLWLGFNPENSGSRSAGNGPAVRALVIGATLIGTDVESRIERWCQLSALLTHKAPQATAGSILLGQAAAIAIMDKLDRDNRLAVLDQLIELSRNDEITELLQKLKPCLEANMAPARVAKRLGWKKGVSGYMPHTLTMAIYCWLRYYNDFGKAVYSAVRLGGDTDSVAAITGGLVGLSAQVDSIPDHLIAKYGDWPADLAWHEQLASRLTEWPHGEEDILSAPAEPFFWPGQIIRNLLLIPVVIAHVFFRWLKRCVGH